MIIPYEIDNIKNKIQINIPSEKTNEFDNYGINNNFNILLEIDSINDYSDFVEIEFKQLNNLHLTLKFHKTVYKSLEINFITEKFVIKSITDTENYLFLNLFYQKNIEPLLIENNKNIISKFKLINNTTSINHKLMYILSETDDIFDRIKLAEAKNTKRDTEIVNHLNHIGKLLKGI